MNSTETLYADRYLVTHAVDPKRQGERLDRFLKSYYQTRSRSQLQRAIEAGSITLERSINPASHAPVRLKPSTPLLAGDEIRIVSIRKPEPEVNFKYDVLFEDENILVVNKPAPLPVHPAGSYFFHTLLVHLKTKGFTEPLRLERDFYLAHRIDRETSGVLVLAKNKEVCAKLVSQFAERLTKKSYLAIVHGVPKQNRFEITLPLGKDPQSKIRVKISPIPEDQGGLHAHTDVEVLESYAGGRFSLIRCYPRTGRQHQIRVHLAAVGHPIVGDKLYSLTEDEAAKFFYAKKEFTLAPVESDDEPKFIRPGASHSIPLFIPAEVYSKLLIERHALHAERLELTHPITNLKTVFEAKLPSELQEFIRVGKLSPATSTSHLGQSSHLHL